MTDAAVITTDTPEKDLENSSVEDVATAETEVPYQLSAEKMMMDNLFILGMLFFIFYFLLIRPQQRRLKAQQKLMKEIKKGDRVITTGGIIGSIIKFEGDDIAVVEVSPNVRVRFSRTAIAEVMDDKSSAKIANDN